jgi:hypothetical protein
LFSPTPPLKVPRLPRSAFTPPTTTSSVSCPAWVASPTPTKHLNPYKWFKTDIHITINM